MANLWVVVTGLGVFVENLEDSTNPSVVLMRSVVPGNQTVGGVNVLPHEPTMMLEPGGIRFLVVGREVDFLPRGSGAPQLVQGNRETLVPLGRELAEAAVVKDEVLKGGILENGIKVILAGGTIEPIHIDQNYQLSQVSRHLNINLVGLFDPASGNRTQIKSRTVANGLLFRRRIPAREGAPSVQIGNRNFPLSPVKKEDMGNLRENNGEDDYVVWIVNVASEFFRDPDPDLDRDFHLLYRWLRDDLPVKYVPITQRQRATGTGEGDPPGQCMFGRALTGI